MLGNSHRSLGSKILHCYPVYDTYYLGHWNEDQKHQIK